MKKRGRLFWFNVTSLIVFLIFITFFNLSCYSPTEPEDNPYITYIVSGGFGGGIHTKLIIDQSRTASLESEYPALKKQLSTEEYNSIINLFSDFKKLPDSEMIRCADSFVYTIEYETNGSIKTVRADNCALSDSTNPVIRKFKPIANKLGQLANQIYNAQASWIGLTAEYKMDKDIYKLDEPIKLTYILKNPTDKERVLYFKNQYKLQFMLYKRDYPSIYYTYPPRDYENDTTNPGKIELAPGEEKSLSYTWDQKILDNGNWIQAPIGSYNISMIFVGTKVNGNSFFIDIVDPSIPIEGQVVPDYNGESYLSKYYNFQLRIKNWTDKPVALDFPSSQKISVQLYTDDIHSKRELIYESTKPQDNQSSQLTILPNDEMTFSSLQSKDDLNLQNITWYYVKIKLLTSNLDFERDAEISIYQYSDNSN